MLDDVNDCGFTVYAFVLPVNHDPVNHDLSGTYDIAALQADVPLLYA